MTRTLRFGLLAIGALALVAIVATQFVGGEARRTDADDGAASQAAGVPIGGDFSLVNQDGEPVTQTDFADRHMLVYFGYAYCPDVCPLSLAIMMNAYDQLPQAVRDAVQPVFITVDPERDDVPAVKAYVEAFGDDLIGLTGTPEQTDAAAKTYRVYYQKTRPEGTSDYLVDHSSYTYLIGPDGYYVTHFNHGDTAEVIAQGVSERLAGVSS